jgi:hypothetical protein
MVSSKILEIFAKKKNRGPRQYPSTNKLLEVLTLEGTPSEPQWQ